MVLTHPGHIDLMEQAIRQLCCFRDYPADQTGEALPTTLTMVTSMFLLPILGLWVGWKMLNQAQICPMCSAALARDPEDLTCGSMERLCLAKNRRGDN